MDGVGSFNDVYTLPDNRPRQHLPAASKFTCYISAWVRCLHTINHDYPHSKGYEIDLQGTGANFTQGPFFSLDIVSLGK